MKYNKDDIHFDQITPKEFERLCYDLLVGYGFQNVIWRDGGADNGRDIEGTFILKNPIQFKEAKYFFECKHYTAGGVPPEHLNSKIAWADAELPDFLVILTTSYLTTAARTWLDKLALQKPYDIICIEGEELKDRLINYPDLIERYFSQGRYEQMLKDIKGYKAKYNIDPSFEILKEIIENIDLSKLDIDDFGFILLNFYGQYSGFEARDDYYGDFDARIMDRILSYLKTRITNETLASFSEYNGNYSTLGGEGIFDEMEWLDNGIENDYQMKKRNFQYYVLHLNHNSAQDLWKIGNYLVTLFEDVAFEIFKTDKTEIRIIKNFTPDRIHELVLDLHDKASADYKM
jgi:hypothetical protein